MEPKTKKILIVSGGIIALTLLGYKLFAKKSTTPNTPLIKPPTSTVTEEPINNEPPSIEDMPGDPNASNTSSKSPYSSEELADMLQSAFSGYGTSWSKGVNGNVVDVLLNLYSDEDFDNLNEAYGIRVVSSGFLNMFQKDFVGDMNAAFNDELSKNEIAEANNILKMRGITRRIQPIMKETQE